MANEITCEGCGQCCMEMGSPPFLTWLDNNDQAGQLPPQVRDEYEAEMVRHVANGCPDDVPCFWFVDGKCEHYEHRPEVCSTFEVGGRHCRWIRDRKKQPPGEDDGKVKSTTTAKI